jgi:hypothetical protein
VLYVVVDGMSRLNDVIYLHLLLILKFSLCVEMLCENFTHCVPVSHGQKE